MSNPLNPLGETFCTVPATTSVPSGACATASYAPTFAGLANVVPVSSVPPDVICATNGVGSLGAAVVTELPTTAISPFDSTIMSPNPSEELGGGGIVT